MKQILLTFYLFFIASISPAAAQSAALVHINQPFYVSGEVIWYKLYLPADFPAGPKAITVSLFDRSGALVDQSYLKRSDEAAVFGFYKIPYEWTSDIYRLVFSATEETTRRPVVLAEAFVPVYDDFSDEKKTTSGPLGIVAPSAAQPKKIGDLKLEISVDRENYPPRSVAEVRIKITNKDGVPVPAALSVSVADHELFDVEHPMLSTVKTGTEQAGFPELEESITLRGTLLEPNGQAILPNGNIGAYLVDQKRFVYAKADEEARFTLELPDVYGPCPIHVGGFWPEDLLVRLDRQIDLSNPAPPQLPYPPTVSRYLEWSRRRKLIYQLYGRLEHTFPASIPTVQDTLEEADSPVVLDEYSAFSDIPTLVKDLLIPIRFRTRKEGVYEARIFDPTAPTRKFHSNGPLFIVDGKLTRNADYIAQLDIAKIERFDLYYDFEKGLRLFGPMARSGLVMIQSRNRNIDVPEADRKNFFTINGFQAKVEYPVQLHSIEETEALLRPAPFWAPNVATNDQGEAMLSIPLPDDRSRFRVEIVAQGEDGARGLGDAYFMVGQE